MTRRASTVLGCAGLAAALGLSGLALARSQASAADYSPAQSDYLLHCGGCHGLQGDSSPAPIPVLRGRVGYFLKSEEGRRYLIRLPNVAHTRIDDNAELAAMMNFVAFGLGGDSAPPSARPYTGDEVALLRRDPMTGNNLIQTRQAVVDDLVRRGAAPRSLKLYYPGQQPAPR